jgi:hypothetical protein
MRKKEDAQKHRDKRTYALHVGMVWGQSKRKLRACKQFTWESMRYMILYKPHSIPFSYSSKPKSTDCITYIFLFLYHNALPPIHIYIYIYIATTPQLNCIISYKNPFLFYFFFLCPYIFNYYKFRTNL